MGSFATALAGCAAAPLRSTGAEPRNVVLILTDDQRWNSLSFLGHPFLQTPHLDRMAAEGAHLPNAFVTTSLCCPSRASILTGLYAHAHNVLDNSSELDPAFPTYATLLRGAGVDTCYVGKWHMGAKNPHPRPGWDRWIGFRGQGRYVYPGGPEVAPLDRGFSFDGELREVEGYVTTLLTDHATEYLRSRRPGRPFCLVLAHKAVHAPFVPRVADRDRFVDGPIPAVLPDTDEAAAGLPAWLRAMRHDREFGVDHPYGKWPDFASWYLDYHRTMLAVDDSVGQVLAALAETGLDRSTLVLFSSDNGFMFGEKGVLDKRNFYEPSIRVPLLAWAPGWIPAGTRAPELALNVDLAPTILEALGYEAPPHWHGRSLVPLLRGLGAPDWRKEFVYQYFFERAFPDTPTLFGLRTERMKFSTTWGMDTADELFDLSVDPGETDNKVADPAYADRKGALAGRLRQRCAALGMVTKPVWGQNWIASPADAAGAVGRRAEGAADEDGGDAEP